MRQRIEELENQGNGDFEVDSNPEEEIKEEQNDKERYPKIRLISYLSNRGSVRVEVSCHDGN